MTTNAQLITVLPLPGVGRFYLLRPENPVQGAEEMEKFLKWRRMSSPTKEEVQEFRETHPKLSGYRILFADWGTLTSIGEGMTVVGAVAPFPRPRR